MTTKNEKYTLMESALVFVLSGLAIIAMFIIMFPCVLLVAWMRETMWNWYAPMFHLPGVSLWMMVVAGLFVGSFMPSHPSLKDDLLKFKSWQNALLVYAGQALGFGIVAVIHVLVR